MSSPAFADRDRFAESLGFASVNGSLAYRLGFGSARAARDGRNLLDFDPNYVPLNGFSNPEMQGPEYQAGVRTGLSPDPDTTLTRRARYTLDRAGLLRTPSEVRARIVPGALLEVVWIEDAQRMLQSVVRGVARLSTSRIIFEPHPVTGGRVSELAVPRFREIRSVGPDSFLLLDTTRDEAWVKFRFVTQEDSIRTGIGNGFPAVGKGRILVSRL